MSATIPFTSPQAAGNRTSTGAPVTVITGAGGMGRAIARRRAGGTTTVLADASEAALTAAADALGADGHAVGTMRVDITDRDAVEALARSAAELGPVTGVVHSAGVSPVGSEVDAVVAVDLIGTAHVLDVFADVIAPGGAGVMIASIAGHSVALAREDEAQLATVPTEELAGLPVVRGLSDSVGAYGLAKRGNALRVAAAAEIWARRGARVNCISPGIIATPMTQAARGSSIDDMITQMLATAPLRRLGTVDEIADVVEFLLGPASTYVTGADLVVDGGAVSAAKLAAAGH